jgi:rubrerythrin
MRPNNPNRSNSIMSIFDSLVEAGVTQEDLEKAASARLFAEAAAAEGIDLSELTEDQAEELYEFWANGGEEAEKSASAEDLLAEAAVKEASAKLAEAEYIGRYMARVYADEMDKIAKDETPGRLRSMGQGMRGLGSDLKEEAKDMYEKGKSKARSGAKSVGNVTGYRDIRDAVKSLRAINKGEKNLPEALRKNPALLAETAGHRSHAYKQLGRGVGKAGLTAGAVGGAGYLAHKAMKKESAFDTVVEQRAMEILEALQEPTFDEAVDAAALDLLRANGYDV